MPRSRQTLWEVRVRRGVFPPQKLDVASYMTAEPEGSGAERWNDEAKMDREITVITCIYYCLFAKRFM